MPDRVESMVPESVVVLERGHSDYSALSICSPETTARSLIASTYMAGELRRYWSFAATLSAGTGIGPAHPPIVEVASGFAAKLPCFSLALGQRPGACLSDLLDTVRVAA